MTLLESILIKLTRDTSNGSSCRIGDAVIVVRFCSDIWEWDYQGETYWDVQDLAEAIIRDSSPTPPIPSFSAAQSPVPSGRSSMR